ncbi:unnamed protein product, partial [Pylaiella littoralis]
GVAAGRCPRGCTTARMTSSLMPASTRFFRKAMTLSRGVPAWLSCGMLGWVLSLCARLRMHFAVDDCTAQASAGILLCCEAAACCGTAEEMRSAALQSSCGASLP